jgi:hypothetical protein
MCELEKETADLSTPLRSGRDDKFVYGVGMISPWKRGHLLATNLSSRPERTWISCFTVLDKATCAAFIKESRMKLTSATNLDRKSGAAQWRALRFLLQILAQTL